MQHQKVANWEAFASTKHALPLSARSLSEEIDSCLFDQDDNVFNSPIFDWDEIEDMETRLGTTPKASAMMDFATATTAQRSTVKRESEPALFDFDLNFFDSDFFNLDVEPRSPCLEHAAVAPSTPPREPVMCAPLIQHTKKRKATMLQSRCRKRPFKNVRERRRRATIKSKLAELNTLCSSDAVTSIVSRPSAEHAAKSIAEGSLDTYKPRKMDILCDSIHIFQAMDEELIKLRARNKELNMHTSK